MVEQLEEKKRWCLVELGETHSPLQPHYETAQPNFYIYPAFIYHIDIDDGAAEQPIHVKKN